MSLREVGGVSGSAHVLACKRVEPSHATDGDTFVGIDLCLAFFFSIAVNKIFCDLARGYSEVKRLNDTPRVLIYLFIYFGDQEKVWTTSQSYVSDMFLL